MSKLSVYRGDDRQYLLTFKDGDGVAIPITGWKIYFTVKKNKYDSDDDAKIKVDWTSHSDPTNGETILSLTKTNTNIDPDEYICDIQIKKVDGAIRTIVVWGFEVHNDITRRVS